MNLPNAARQELSCVVFDLFHTLIDPEVFRPKEYRRPHVVAEILGLDKDQFTSYWRSTLRSRNTSRAKKNIEYVEDYLRSVGKEAGKDALSKADFELGRYQDMAIMNPPREVAPALADLRRRGLRLCILSNSDDSDTRAWQRSPLAPYFDATAFSCDTGYEKPAKDAYLTALDMLKGSPDDAAYVGDGGNGELEGAQDAGFQAVVFMRGNVAIDGMRTPQEIGHFERVADHIIDSMAELLTLIDRIDLKKR